MCIPDIDDPDRQPSARNKIKTTHPLRMWGLWMTLDYRTYCSAAQPDKCSWVDLSQSPVSRIKWSMMHHHSMDLWQVHLFMDSEVRWDQWLPSTRVCVA